MQCVILDEFSDCESMDINEIQTWRVNRMKIWVVFTEIQIIGNAISVIFCLLDLDNLLLPMCLLL